MNKPHRSPQMLIFAVTMLLALPPASRAQVRVMMSGGFSAAYQELLPEFQNTTGITVTTARGASQGDGPNTIGAQIRRGVPADVVIMSRDGLAELIAEDRIAIGSDVDLARVPLGIGVRAGTPRPDIATVDALQQTLLRAKSIGIQSSSAIYLTTKLFPQLGIASAMVGKLSKGGAANVASGELEMVILPMSEILPVPGVDFVGTIPAGIQFFQVFAAALLKRREGTRSIETAHRIPGVGKSNFCDREDRDEAPGISTTDQLRLQHRFAREDVDQGLSGTVGLVGLAAGRSPKIFRHSGPRCVKQESPGFSPGEVQNNWDFNAPRNDI